MAPVRIAAAAAAAAAVTPTCAASAIPLASTSLLRSRRGRRPRLQPSIDGGSCNSSNSSSSSSSSSIRHSSSSARPVEGFSSLHPPSSSSSSSSEQSRRLGQPLPTTHPHLFPRYDVARPFPQLFPDAATPPSYDYHPSLAGENSQQELTPGITRSEYETRRRRLMDQVEDRGVVLVMGGRIKYMSESIFYRFRQDTSFFYLTGFQEPDAAMILQKQSSSPRGFKMTMFVAPDSAHNQQWHGWRSDIDGARSVFGADEAVHLDDNGRSLLDVLKQILPDATKIYHEPPATPTVPRRSSRSPPLLDYLAAPSPGPLNAFKSKTDFETVTRLLSDTKRSTPLSPLLNELRLSKSASELRLMRRAGQIAGLAHNSAMHFSNTPLATTEWAVQSHFEYVASLLGASRSAYVPVVAAGERGCIMHYTDNDHQLQKGLRSTNDEGQSIGQMLAMDAGVEFAGYNSDISRAWPVASSLGPRGDDRIGFTSAQRDLYEAVLRVLKECTKLCTEDQGYSLKTMHEVSVQLLYAELRDLGFGVTSRDSAVKYYPHYLSHWLGLDLHDIADQSTRNRPLRVGQTLTVEPGLYIPPLHSNVHRSISFVPKHFAGIGFRIEDDVAVGRTKADGPVVLSAEAVKEVEDVLAVCEGRFPVGAGAEAVGSDVLDGEVRRHLLSGGRTLGFD